MAVTFCFAEQRLELGDLGIGDRVGRHRHCVRTRAPPVRLGGIAMVAGER